MSKSNTYSLKPVHRIKTTSKRVWSVSVHRDYLACSTDDPYITVYKFDPNTTRHIPHDTVTTSLSSNNVSCLSSFTVIGPHSKTIRSLAFSPCGTFLAACSFDSYISVYHVKKNDTKWPCIASLEGHENEVKCVAWSRDSSFLASCGRDRTVWIWSVLPPFNNSHDMLTSDSNEVEIECQAVLQEHTQDVKYLAWHPTCNLLASSSYDESVKVIKAVGDEDADWVVVEDLKGVECTVWAVEWGCEPNDNAETEADGMDTREQRDDVLYGALDTGFIAKWTSSGDNNHPMLVDVNHHGPLYSIAIHPSINTLLALAGQDRTITLLDSQTQQLYKLEMAHESDINCLKWWHKENNSYWLVSASDDGTIGIWELNDFQ